MMLIVFGTGEESIRIFEDRSRKRAARISGPGRVRVTEKSDSQRE